MEYINISSDIDESMKDVGDFFRRQMRFVMMMSINDTARDVQSHLSGVTLPSAIPRNKALPKAMTRFIPDDMSGQGGLFRTSNFLTSKDTVVIGPARDKGGRVAGEGFAERQVSGDVKRPRGSVIAIPKEGPGLKRLAGGSIPKAKKPKAIRGNDKFFVKGGNIYERMGAKGKKIRLRYALVKQARGTTVFSGVYPEAHRVVDQVFSGHFDTHMTKALMNSRFFPG